LYLLVSVSIAVLLNVIAILMVRVWNPSREESPAMAEEDIPRHESLFASKSSAPQFADTSVGPVVTGDSSSGEEKPFRPTDRTSKTFRTGRTRTVWDNPIIWREIRTWAYGGKILAIRLAYLSLFALAAGFIYLTARSGDAAGASHITAALASLFLLSLILVNAQAVTSLTSERDAKALDLLLVTDLTPKEIIFGKLGGVLYNTKEMICLPLLLCAYLWINKSISLENAIFLSVGLAVLYFFVSVLGIHAGITYANSGSAIAASLGTVFFLTVGVAACMRIMLAFSGSFQAQFVPFFAYMVLGGVGLYVVLGLRNPSAAIGVASFLCPFATFYAITSYFLGATLAMFLAMVAAYGFTTAAMLVPAIYEFDVAAGRTTIDE
jgi:hypothetical protein